MLNLLQQHMYHLLCCRSYNRFWWHVKNSKTATVKFGWHMHTDNNTSSSQAMVEKHFVFISRSDHICWISWLCVMSTQQHDSIQKARNTLKDWGAAARSGWWGSQARSSWFLVDQPEPKAVAKWRRRWFVSQLHWKKRQKEKYAGAKMCEL